MTQARAYVRALALPLKRAMGASSASKASSASSASRSSWLWSSWERASEQQASLQSVGDMQSLELRFEAFGAHLRSSVWSKFIASWRRLETAPAGSLRNRWYRFIVNVVLKREDPRESFLKSIPLDNGTLDVTYPDHLPEKLVRRRLRLLAMQGRARHRRGVMLWSLAFIPQMPLMVTPLPNISVYYTLYRLYSHIRALKGSFMLGHGFHALDAKQLVDLREQLSGYDADDLIPGSWPHKLLTGDRSYREFFRQVFITHNKRRLEQRLATMLHKSSMGADLAPRVDGAKDVGDDGEINTDASTYLASTSDGKPPPGHVAVLDTGLHLYFEPSAKLREILLEDAQEDRGDPEQAMTDEAVAKIGEAFGAPNLVGDVSRARLYLKKRRNLL
jgi:hypothetical protein